MNEKLKTILIICGILFILWILSKNEESKMNDDIYKTEITKYNYNICGNNFSIYDYLYNDEIDINQLLDSIDDACNY